MFIPSLGINTRVPPLAASSFKYDTHNMWSRFSRINIKFSRPEDNCHPRLEEDGSWRVSADKFGDNQFSAFDHRSLLAAFHNQSSSAVVTAGLP